MSLGLDDDAPQRMFDLCMFGLCITLLFLPVWTRYHRGLNTIPGPFLASISSFWKFKAVLGEDLTHRSSQLHEKYGPLVRIGPNHVSASSAEALQVIHRAKTGFIKSSTYSLLQPRLDGQILHNIFSTQDAVFHASLKRTMGSSYSMTAATELEFHIDTCAKLLISRLSDLAQIQPANVDMSAWLQYYALDSLSAMNFSCTLGALAQGRDIHGICKFSHEQMRYFGLMGQVPQIEQVWSALKSLIWTMKPHPLVTFSIDRVKQRQQKPTNSKDMLNIFLELHRTHSETFGIRDVIAATYINVVTSHDVLAITLRAILYHLCKNPDAQQKLCRELLEAEHLDALSDPVQYTEAANLKYVSAVINEALRIHPSTGTILERRVPKGGVTLHGVHIAEDTIIGVNAWVMNRNKDIFGDDVENFRPERWIDSTPEAVQDMRKNLFTFGAGSRYCIGKNFAMMQMVKIIVELYRNFEITLARPDEEWQFAGGWLTSQTQLDMVLRKKRPIIQTLNAG